MILPLFFGASIWGSKNFTEIPHRSLQAAGFSAARFAPRSPQSLEASFRGAKTSQQFCAAICLRRLFQRRDLLPAPRKALRLRSGEQNLHRDSAPPSASGGFFSGAICSPQSLAPSFRGAKSSHKFRAAICLRRPFQRRDLLPAPRKALRLRFGEQNLHRSSAPVRATGGSCWRHPAGKAIYHRRVTPTGRPGYEGREKDCRYLSILF